MYEHIYIYIYMNIGSAHAHMRICMHIYEACRRRYVYMAYMIHVTLHARIFHFIEGLMAPATNIQKQAIWRYEHPWPRDRCIVRTEPEFSLTFCVGHMFVPMRTGKATCTAGALTAG